jgi:hypothetical protein
LFKNSFQGGFQIYSVLDKEVYQKEEKRQCKIKDREEVGGVILRGNIEIIGH